MTVQVVELQRVGGKFYFILPAEFDATAMLFESLADDALRENMICMTHHKARADEIAAALNSPEAGVLEAAIHLVNQVTFLGSDDVENHRGALNSLVEKVLLLKLQNITAPKTADEAFQQRVDASKYVQALSYSAERRVLDVVFRSNPGWIYAYEEFPPGKWEELQAAESVGSYISRVVVGPVGKNRPPLPPFKYTKRAVS